ncbi:MAG: DUF697 domain-containing protein [Coriobacteriales bacterium]|jgi:uncharacterized protein (DUF697 family)|nr:DUF697 domain-containing protein [Coriobacteriales bacterium]
MAKKKNIFSYLPLNLRQVNRISGAIGGNANKEMNVLLLVDKTADQALLDYAQKQLLPLSQNVSVDVVAYSDSRPKLKRDADLTLIIAGNSSHTSTLVTYAHEFELDWAAIVCNPSVLTDGLATEEAKTIAERIIPFFVEKEQSESEKNTLLALEAVFKELASILARKLPQTRLALGRAWPFARAEIAQELIRSVAFQNAMIAAAFFIPAADMPVLTANQCRMLLQLSQLYGLELGNERLKEVGALIVSAFGARTLARMLVSRLGWFAWAMRASVAWSTTFAIGQAGIAFYSHGGKLKIPDFQGLKNFPLSFKSSIAQKPSCELSNLQASITKSD